MSFLDRFKLQPKWKHADPAIRAAAVAEIPDDDEHQAVILELATSDDDLRVRRAAADRIGRVEDLVRLARSERDESFRRDLAERLVGIAVSPADADGDAALALEGLEDQKQLAAIAKGSPHDTVRTAALGRIHDVKVLSGVARQAADAQTALEAVMRIADAAELIAVATKTEHKDAGLTALERAAEASAPGDVRELLDGVAGRAKNRVVSKRARTMIQEIEEAEAARRAALEAWQQRVAAVLARVEVLSAAPSASSARAQLAEAEAEWLELASSGTFAVDPDTNSRFGALVIEAHEAIDRHEQQEAERRSAEERRMAIEDAKTRLCERIDALTGEDIFDEIAKARSEWEGMAAPDAAPTPALDARFEAACQRAADRFANRQELQRIHARLDALSTEAERLASADEPDEAALASTIGEWRTLVEQADGLDPAVAQRMADAEGRLRQRDEQRKATAERAARQHVQRLEQLIDRADKRVAAEDLNVREADRIARDLRAGIEAPLPPTIDERERHALLEKLRAAQSRVAPRLHELREMDEWKRFANAAVQEELIAQTEALRTKYHLDSEEGPKPEEVENAARELHDIQERWKQVAEAPRAQAQALWHRYRQAADPIQTKAREFFAARAEERKGNLDRKLALIERAEALAESTDWIKTAEELKKLQHEWQQIGPVPRHDTRATWKRFRDACDRFFTRRNADLAERKETWSANLAKKEALCARAEELASSREWDRAAAEIRRLQAEWKTVGPVRRNKSEAVWQRFRTACDAFFDRFKRRDEVDLEAKQADREALLTELDALAHPSSPDAAPTPPADLLERVRSLRSRWNQTTPVVRHGADPLSARFVDTLERVIAAYPDQYRGTELDVDANRQKMEKLCAKVEGFIADAPAAPASSSQALANMLREALASNTIGGRGGEEARWRAMAEDVRTAQGAWNRLGPVPGQAGRDLSERFHRACHRFFDQYHRRVPQQPSGKRKELQPR
jgi:hypothetical protein